MKPSEILAVERRGAPRQEPAFPIWGQLLLELDSSVRALSTGGMMVRVATPPPLGTAQVFVPNPVQSVSNGEEVIAYLNGSGKYADRQHFPLPVVLFLDLNMPKKDGLEVLEWIREQEGGVRTVPVVMFSSSSHGVDISAGQEYAAYWRR